LFLFLFVLSWIVALAADPYAGLPSEKERKTVEKEKRKKEN
jgi:hypothetical protein